jgi:membrane protease YdiL (CAAX protease family)
MAILFIIAIVGYYWFVPPRLAVFVGPLTKHFPSLPNFAHSTAESIVKLALAGVSQLVFCLALIWIGALHGNDLGVSSCPPVLLLYGLVLGVGEMALASFIAFVATRLIDAVQKDSLRGGPEAWLAMSRGGWMRQYLRTIESAPWPIALGLTLLYVSAEEVVFRSIIIHIWLPHRLVALMISVGLFSVVQQFKMPSWRHGFFAFVGALVMGTIHGILYLQLPFIIPLIIAHLTFFGSAVLVRREQLNFEP